jgi:hypothetical protein
MWVQAGECTMEIAAKRVFAALKEKGIENVYHANSVVTTCQFLRAGALLSRGAVEATGGFQTDQYSDDGDKKHSLWHDVFLDGVDIHDRRRSINNYGPVLLVFDLEIVKESGSEGMWVTKTNPTKWDGKLHKDKWFSSQKELKSGLIKGEFDQMLVFRHNGGRVAFNGMLTKIILDDPVRKTPASVDYYSMAFGALTLAAMEGGLYVKVSRRKCRPGCKCVASYRSNNDRTLRMFWPKLFD